MFIDIGAYYFTIKHGFPKGLFCGFFLLFLNSSFISVCVRYTIIIMYDDNNEHL